MNLDLFCSILILPAFFIESTHYDSDFASDNESNYFFSDRGIFHPTCPAFEFDFSEVASKKSKSSSRGPWLVLTGRVGPCSGNTKTLLKTQGILYHSQSLSSWVSGCSYNRDIHSHLSECSHNRGWIAEREFAYASAYACMHACSGK
jgi:hypothetical protein